MPERVALSTELNEFLVEFSIALHRTSMYPPGHPSQEKSASGVIQRLSILLADRPSVSIGVARHQLVIEGVATDPRHPVLRGLAEKFHKQHIGAVVLQRGVSSSEVAAMMQLVAREAEKGERPLGLGDAELLRQWPNVRLYALTYDQLELVGDPNDDDDQDDEQRAQGTRSAQLWIGLARAALSAEERPELPDTEPAAVAQAINEHPQAQAYDQVVVGYLLQIAQELKQDGGVTSAAVKRRMTRLIQALDPATLNRLVEMGGDLGQRKQFVLDATDSLAVDAVVEIVRAAADTSGQNISTSLVRMLSKLSSFAEQGPQQLQVQADTALREQVRDLVQGWSLSDPNPDAYTRALQTMSLEQVGERRAAQAHAPEPLRIVQMAIEVESVGVPFWRAVHALEHGDGLAELVRVLQAASPGNSVVRVLWQHIATEAAVRRLLQRDVVDFEVVGALLAQLATDRAVEILLDSLTDAESRATRMGAFRRIVALGAAAVPAVTSRLSDDRWYVQRNMLAILNEMAELPTSFSPAVYARHDDARVRREALQVWLRVPHERERAIAACLKESDDRALRSGLAAALQHGTPEAAVPLIAARLADVTVTTDIRLQLVRMLGQVRSPLAVDALLKVAVAGKSLFGAPRLAETTPTLLVALTTLAEKWPNDPRVKPVLDRARAAKDSDVRLALEKAKPQ